MRLMSFIDSAGRAGLAVADGDTLRDVTAAVTGPASSGLSPMRQLLSRGLNAVAIAELAAFAPNAPLADAAVVSPIVPDPTKIVAAPVNYRDHQVEMTQASAIESLGVFLKAPSSLLGDGGTVSLPYDDRRFDQEGELGVVIGRTASHVSLTAALDYVAGYTCLLDMTMRGGEDRSVRKSFDTFTPVGPWLVTPDEVGPISELELHTWVGGELRQRADLADLIWDVPQLITYISSVMVLHPGDIIATGTPAGVGQVHDGEQVAVEISRIGHLEVTVSSVGAVACPTRGKDAGPPPPDTVTPPRERVPA